MFSSEANSSEAIGFAISQIREKLGQLLRPGFIGLYDHIEVVEVIATPPDGKAMNVVSIVVFGEDAAAVEMDKQPDIQPLKSLRVDGYKNWRFGLVQYVRPMLALDEALKRFATDHTWSLSGQPLAVGKLMPQPFVFVPPDGTEVIPINAFLKNNFWSGSHVLRLLDPDKTLLQPLFEDRRRLQTLSDAVADILPISFSGLADFLGDIVIQLPVTVLVPAMNMPRGEEDLLASVKWHPKCKPRQLQISARIRWDGLILDADVSKPFETSTRLAVDGHRQQVAGEIWDVGTNILMAASASTSTLKQINVDVHMMRHEPRVFTVLDESGLRQPARIKLTDTNRIKVGEIATNDTIHWQGRRQHLEEAKRLADTREFVQYLPKPGTSDERIRALHDVRFLINQHGCDGVDLWDPFLTAEDILQTLFWCKHAGTRLRALTDGRDPPRKKLESKTSPFPDRQKAVLAQHAGNLEGLRLEYRTRRNQQGWTFHDRFLIFPGGSEGPSAWSLGTSINSIGTAHHILQRVSNAALIAGAFEDLWSTLDQPLHLIWRS